MYTYEHVLVQIKIIMDKLITWDASIVLAPLYVHNIERFIVSYHKVAEKVSMKKMSTYEHFTAKENRYGSRYSNNDVKRKLKENFSNRTIKRSESQSKQLIFQSISDMAVYNEKCFRCDRNTLSGKGRILYIILSIFFDINHEKRITEL